ncbi:Sister chromatid cohesion protein PDS5 C [Trifolium repens]|nr:Sister chromatid cohesion protein PDS5 C [Trifolium repens]
MASSIAKSFEEELLEAKIKPFDPPSSVQQVDDDVKVALASCFNEIAKITAPDAPYNDYQMKEVLRLIVSLFGNLHDKSSRWYAERISILEIVAKVRLCAVMLDLECDALILEMLQHIFKAIR